MLEFDSPGKASKDFITALLSRDSTTVRGANIGHKQRKCAARVLCAMYACAPNWLAAESVSAAMPAASRKPRVHAQCQCRSANKRPERGSPECARMPNVTTVALR
jgi:hypothetical protein